MKLSTRDKKLKKLADLLDFPGRESARVVYLDVETTGLCPNDEILAISIIDDTGSVVFDTLVRPVSHVIWPEAQLIHGITPEMVLSSDLKTYDDILPRLTQIIRAVDQVVIYNREYDLMYLEDIPGLRKKAVCAMTAFSVYRGVSKWFKLIDAANYCGFDEQVKYHSTLGDCRATRYVWQYMRHALTHWGFGFSPEHYAV